MQQGDTLWLSCSSTLQLVFLKKQTEAKGVVVSLRFRSAPELRNPLPCVRVHALHFDSL